MAQLLHQLVYISHATDSFSGKPDLDQILNSARTRNTESQVTGLLVFRAGVFIQLLEGPHASVENIYQRISQDRRHGSVEILMTRDIEERMFPKWSMSYYEIGSTDLEFFKRFRSWDDFIASPQVGTEQLEELLIDFKFKVAA